MCIRDRFNNMEMASICSQLALILKSGISLLEGISIMLEDAGTEEERRILQTLLDEVMMHGSLNLAMETVGLFPAYAVQMVKIGEETGTLDEVMQALADHYEREDSISKGIRQAVTYPLLMAGLMVLVIVVLLIKVMPIFNQVFVQLGTEMTGFSRVLMNMGNVLSRYSVVFAVILIVIVLAILVGTHTQKGRDVYKRQTLFSSDTVGGENTIGGGGLNEVNSALKDYFYLDTLSSGQSGSVELTVALDGETQGNDYQNTLADLQVNFAVQLNDTATPNQPSKNTSTWVKTGDDTNLVPYFIAAGAGGVLLLGLGAYSISMRKKDKKGEA